MGDQAGIFTNDDITGYDQDGIPIVGDGNIASTTVTVTSQFVSPVTSFFQNTIPPILNALANTSWLPTISGVLPVGTPFGLPFLGIEVDATYVPRTNQLCGAIGPVLGLGPVGGITGGALFDPFNQAGNVLPGTSLNVTIPILRLFSSTAVVTPQSGALFGVAVVSEAGASPTISATVGDCMQVPIYFFP